MFAPRKASAIAARHVSTSGTEGALKEGQVVWLYSTADDTMPSFTETKGEVPANGKLLCAGVTVEPVAYGKKTDRPKRKRQGGNSHPIFVQGSVRLTYEDANKKQYNLHDAVVVDDVPIGTCGEPKHKTDEYINVYLDNALATLAMEYTFAKDSGMHFFWPSSEGAVVVAVATAGAAAGGASSVGGGIGAVVAGKVKPADAVKPADKAAEAAAKAAAEAKAEAAAKAKKARLKKVKASVASTRSKLLKGKAAGDPAKDPDDPVLAPAVASRALAKDG